MSLSCKAFLALLDSKSSDFSLRLHTEILGSEMFHDRILEASAAVSTRTWTRRVGSGRCLLYKFWAAAGA